jgi:hypothetical protein
MNIKRLMTKTIEGEGWEGGGGGAGGDLDKMLPGIDSKVWGLKRAYTCKEGWEGEVSFRQHTLHAQAGTARVWEAVSAQCLCHPKRGRANRT